MIYTTIAVIYNPNSTGPGEKLARSFAARIREQLPKQKLELIATNFAGHGEELAYEIASTYEHPLIISSSGDGGYNDILNGAMKAQRRGRKVTLGLLPAGNANDHHKNVHTEDIVQQIVDGMSQRIDILKIIGKSNGKTVERYAHSYIGFGLTPFVASELNKTKLNPIKETYIVLKSLFTVKPVRLKVGLKVRAYESIVCSNIDVMSKYLKISRPSSVTDGKFEVTTFTRRNKLKLILVLLEATIKAAEEDKQVRRFSLRTTAPTLVQVDGEIIELDAKSRALITAERKLLRCVV